MSLPHEDWMCFVRRHWRRHACHIQPELRKNHSLVSDCSGTSRGEVALSPQCTEDLAPGQMLVISKKARKKKKRFISISDSFDHHHLSFPPGVVGIHGIPSSFRIHFACLFIPEPTSVSQSVSHLSCPSIHHVLRNSDTRPAAGAARSQLNSNLDELRSSFAASALRYALIIWTHFIAVPIASPSPHSTSTMSLPALLRL
ncbi:hypothetical protein Mapa_008373 [Marchantia paleacea]|nr:hypothetical protein Mapa_008373 [Marchantia paleacea]